MSWPIYCGHGSCTELATVLIDATPGRARVACPRCQPAATAWVTAGGGKVTVTQVTQPPGAIPGHGQDTLFDIPGGGQ